jgi:hypothetical protein
MTNLEEKTVRIVALVSCALSVVAVIVFAAIRLSIEPVWTLGLIAALSAGLGIIRKWPLAPVAGLLFIGNFKSIPANGISLTDPTMIVLLLALSAIFIELLFAVSSNSRKSLHELFAGQALGILLFLCFTSVLALSYLYTPAHEYGQTKLLHFVVFQSIVFFAPLILIHDEKDLEQLLIAFFLLGLALAIKSIYVFLHPTAQVLAGEKDITHIGAAQLIGMTLLIFFYAQPFRRFPKILAVPVLGIGLVACAARGPLLSMLVVMVVYSFAARKNAGFVTYKQILLGIAVVMIVTGGALLWIQRYPAAQAKIAEKQLELEAFAGGAANPGGTMEQRLDFYRSAISAFCKEPLIGLGLDGWTVYYYGLEKSDYPHNIVLEIAAEQGVIGLASFLAFLAAVWMASRRIWRQRPGYAFAIPLFVYSFLVCMFSGDINVRALWFWSGTIFAISRMCFSREEEQWSPAPEAQHSLAQVAV